MKLFWKKIPEQLRRLSIVVLLLIIACLHHLRFLKRDIVTRLNNDIGQALVSDIKFKIGSF